MDVTDEGRYQFNNEWLKTKTLDEAIKDHKQVNPKTVQAAWERVNGKPEKKKAPKKETSKED